MRPRSWVMPAAGRLRLMTTGKSPARDALLAATAELTYTRGINNTGVDAIVAKAGVTKRTLYQHFGCKDELVAASLRVRNQIAIDLLRAGAKKRAARTGEPAVLALYDQVKAALKFGPNGCAFLNASLEINNPEHVVYKAAVEHLHAREELISELLVDEGIEDGDLTAELALLLDGAFAVAASRRDPGVALRAKRIARSLLDEQASRDSR